MFYMYISITRIYLSHPCDAELFINHRDQKFFLNLKSSEMSQLVFFDSFECRCYGPTAIINIKKKN